MGELFELINIEVIQNGLFQIDIRGEETNQFIRFFVRPEELFNKIGISMGKNLDKYFEETYKEFSKVESIKLKDSNEKTLMTFDDQPIGSLHYDD